MSKIIKDGTIPRLTTTCIVCDCEFEYDYRDLVSRYEDGVMDSIVCPCCNHGIRITDRAVDILTHLPKLGITVELTKDKILY